jgi:hypothetical protein
VRVNAALADVTIETIVLAQVSSADEMHPATAMKLLDSCMRRLNQLGASDRLWLFFRVKAALASESCPHRKQVLDWLAWELLEK